jgi:regulator of sigma E protease
MAQYLNYLYVAVVVVLLFGAAIFVHEFGHFWVALKRGLKVEAFAIGFGPKIYGWVRNGIEYSIRWIPAGGYVKLPQMVTSEALEGESGGEKLPPASPVSKILVAFAGPFMNIVFAFAIATFLYFVGLPVAVNPPVVGYVEPGSEEAQLGIREGDRVVLVNGKPVKTWQDVQMHTFFALTNKIPVVIDRNGERKTYDLTAKVNEVIGLKILNLDPKAHPIVRELVEKDGAAAKAGLKVNDEFISFAGVPIASQEQLVQLIRKRPGEATEIVVKRLGKKLSLTVTPDVNQETKQGKIGVGLAESRVIVYEIQHPNPWDQISAVWDRTVATLNALFHSKQTGVGIKDLSGPPGIFAMLAAYVNTDYRLALSFLVLLNINLAILNLLPIPVLDGGHIVMAIVEKIRRRPINARLVEYTTTAFAVLLIGFMIFVSFNDVTKRFGLFKSMFQHESRIEESAPAGADASPAKTVQ